MLPQIIVVPALYLQAPDGTVWKITVDANGIVHTQNVGTLPLS